MTDEKLHRANELKKEIDKIDLLVDSEELWIWNGYSNSGFNFSAYRNKELQQQLREMLTDRMETLQQEYDAL